MNFAANLGEFSAAALRLLPAETAHEIGMHILKFRLARLLPRPKPVFSGFKLHQKASGIGQLRHPIGLAAGFDKNAFALPGFCDLGFSFIETGTITPLPQIGNPKPRLFRQKGEASLINRMGFNNDGHRAVLERLKTLRLPVPIGVNLGKNKTTPVERSLSDYLKGISQFKDIADYLVINISSPNTPGLRDLANPEFISQLASEVRLQFADSLKNIWIKLDPDMPIKIFQNLVEAIAQSEFAGLILTNTHRVEWPQSGGMSGHILSHLSSERLEWAYQVHQGQLPMIGCGGIFSGIDVFHKLARGASAVQIYTALVYRGPWAVLHMLDELQAEMKLRGFTDLSTVIGSHYQGGD